MNEFEEKYDVIMKKLDEAADDDDARFVELLQEIRELFPAEIWAEIVADMTSDDREFYEESMAKAREYKPSV